MTWAPDYCTLAELKSYLKIDDTSDDVVLPVWITTASRAVDNYAGRQFGHTDVAETRTYNGVYDRHLGCWVVHIDDLYDDDDLTIVGRQAQVITDYELGPANADKRGVPFERILLSAPGPYALDSSSWGWATVPAAAKTATMLQAARLAARRDSPYGIAGSPNEGNQTVLLYATLDPDLRTSLTPVRRQWWAA